MVHLEDDGTLFVSAEPCHWGMIHVPDTPQPEFKPHLKRMEFQPYPWEEARVIVDA